MTTPKHRFLEILRIKAEYNNKNPGKLTTGSLALRPDQEQAIKEVFDDKIIINEV